MDTICPLLASSTASESLHVRPKSFDCATQTRVAATMLNSKGCPLAAVVHPPVSPASVGVPRVVHSA